MTKLCTGPGGHNGPFKFERWSPVPASECRSVMRLQMLPGQTIVKRGSWLYDGSVRSAVAIVRGHVFYGSGDDEDPPETRDDRQVEAFQLWFETPPGSGDFRAGSQQFLSLREAMDAAVRLLPSPPWWE
jgi:hypothetical protein